MARTTIYKQDEYAEIRVGYLDENGAIFSADERSGSLPVGRVHDATVFRTTTHDEREVGRFSADGRVHSHGLFEGGSIGWTDPDGVVVQAGLIFGEEEVGRVEGPQAHAAGAALLLIFIPEADETRRLAQR